MPNLSDRETEVLEAIRAEGPDGADLPALHRRLIGGDLERGAISDLESVVRVLLRFGVIDYVGEGLAAVDPLDWPLDDVEASRLAINLADAHHLTPREAREFLDPALAGDRAEDLRHIAAVRAREHRSQPQERAKRIDAVIDWVLGEIEADIDRSDKAAALEGTTAGHAFAWSGVEHAAASLHDLLRARALLR